LYVNQAFAELLGFPSPAALLSAGSLGARVVEHELPRVEAISRDVLQRHSPLANFVFEASRTDGVRVWLECTVRRTAWKGIPALHLTAVDVSARREAEQRDRQRHEALTHAARLSTLGAMASGLAHELNQPLCALSSYASAAQELAHREAPRARELPRLLGEIELQARRAAGIVRHLRDLVRRGESRWVELDLNQVITQSVELCVTQAIDRQVQLELALCDALPRVRGNAVELEQVLLNLILNAVDALEAQIAGSRIVQLGAELDTAARRVRVWVKDNGPGVRPDLLDQADTSYQSDKPGGLGLGLAISRSIIEAHGGQLELDSGREGGTTFSFTLPTKTASEA
jgi:PAS domain S-box-containing protein